MCSGASGIEKVDLEELLPVSTLLCLPSAQLLTNTSTGPVHFGSSISFKFEYSYNQKLEVRSSRLLKNDSFIVTVAAQAREF